MKKNARIALTLSTETLRALTRDAAAGVVGGRRPLPDTQQLRCTSPTADANCNTDRCPTAWMCSPTFNCA